MTRGRWWKLWCKEVAARTLLAAGVSRVNTVAQRARFGGRRTLILSYHRVVSDFGREVGAAIPGLLVSAETLRRQLEELGRRYEVVSLAVALREMRAQSGGPDLAAVTFDDGYADVVRNGLPVLRRLRMPATVFLVAGFVESGQPLPHDRLHASLRALRRQGLVPADLPASAAREWLDVLLRSGCSEEQALDGLLAALPDREIRSLARDIESRIGNRVCEPAGGGGLLSWEMVRELIDGGVAIGAHTMGHRVLTHLGAPEIRSELRDARSRIHERTGVDPLDFAYPNGWYSEGIVREVIAAGYRCALTTEARHNGPGEDPYRLGRYTLWEGSTLGPSGYSRAIASCQLDGSFKVLGIPRTVSGRVEARGLAVRGRNAVPTLHGH